MKVLFTPFLDLVCGVIREEVGKESCRVQSGLHAMR